jgi:hypothetical protein
MISFDQPQDLFVGCVAIALGLGALAAAASGGKLVGWSPVAQGLQRLGGIWVVVLVYGAIGIFLIGVGLSLIL